MRHVVRHARLAIAGLVAAAAIAAAAPAATDPAPVASRAPAAMVPDPPGGAAPYCPGEYADEFAALSRSARDYDLQQQPYTYCIRSSAVYECPFYAPDGALRRTQRRVVAHGTGFGLRQEGGDTLIVTNEHVAEWPAVTDGEHPVDDVPPGCRRVSDALRIVEKEGDDYERDDIPLARAVADPQLDVAVLRANRALPVLPWRIGRSAALRERNVVDVRGFPLGVLRANNAGKVISAYDHDEQRDWDHDDFVIDALLSPGNSGSPVFAISCRTGEFELVGVYHAGYAQGSALNVVVGVDQLRDLLATLKRPPRARRDPVLAVDAAGARLRLFDQAQVTGRASFPFGFLVGWVRARGDGALVFEVMSRDFPLQSVPALVLEDLPPRTGSGFGSAGKIWAGNRQGLREIDKGALDAETQGQIGRLLEALRRDALLAVSYRAAARAVTSRERFQEMTRLERAARRSAASRQYLAQGAVDLAERLCPNTADATGTIADALAIPLLPPPHDAAQALPAAGAAASAAGDGPGPALAKPADGR